MNRALNKSVPFLIQSLLTAFLQSEQSAVQQQTLSEVTKKLTALLPMIFNNALNKSVPFLLLNWSLR